MIYLLIVYFCCFFLPLFVCSSRAGFLGLSGQALVIAVMLLRENAQGSLSLGIQIADIILVRGLLIPGFFLSLLRKLSIKREFNLLPANFVFWTLALTLVVCGYWFGRKIFPTQDQEALQVGVSAIGILVGLFVLSSQKFLIGQIIGVLMIENGILLFETFSHPSKDWIMQAGLSLVYLWFCWTLSYFLKNLSLFQPGALLEEKREVL